MLQTVETKIKQTTDRQTADGRAIIANVNVNRKLSLQLWTRYVVFMNY